MVKFSWDEGILQDFVRYMYKQNNYTEISKPNLTYQKANNKTTYWKNQIELIY